MNQKNNYAFIDGNNLYLGVRSQGWKLDYLKFRIFLRDKYGVTKAFLFIGYIPGNETMYKTFQEQGYICIFKPTLEIKDGKVKKVKGNVDADLVLRAMVEYLNYDKAVIVSSDGDFYCLIEYLITQNKLLKIIVPNDRYSSLLRKFSKFIVNIGLFRNKIEYAN
jgi:uncharacterized LabA/DUF88 family protein